MKAKRLLFLVMAICLASGVKAQFYDSADDIYYYVEYKDGNYVTDGNVLIFNFDGKKACKLGDSIVRSLKDLMKTNPNYYDEKVETSEYDFVYKYLSGVVYERKCDPRRYVRYPSWNVTEIVDETKYERYAFSSDRSLCYDKSYTVSDILETTYLDLNGSFHTKRSETEKSPVRTYKKVEKSFFRVGRSRNPSGTMHE